VLHGHVLPLPPISAHTTPTLQDVLSGVAFTALTLLVGLLVLLPRRLPGPLSGVVRLWRALAHGLHALHSGHPGDYIAWLTVGAVIFTGVFALSFS
jgi:multicomponent Na+:H+ antiporter subunit D